jgi:uncharacterized protein (TIGR00255 family)
MTGYGWSQVEIDGNKCTIEIKSVNHRFCDVTIRAPKSILSFEDAIKKCVTQEIHRGKVEVNINLSELWLKKAIQIDWTLADTFYRALKELKTRYNLDGTISIRDMLSLPELFVVEDQEEHASLERPVLEGVKQAVRQLITMRKEEGKAIIQDIRMRNEQIRQTVEQIESYATEVKWEYGNRLRQRLEEFLSHKAEIDETRLLNEIAILAEKADISEECTRLKSHCQQFDQFLNSSEPVGRKLEFLVQEMNREINTIGSKAHAVEISQSVIQIKSELEKIREQIQNVE